VTLRLAVTGRAGQVATALARRPDGDLVVLLAGRPELDLAAPATIGPALAALKPDVIVSAAAWTAVDNAEKEPDAAFAANATGAGAVAAAAARLGIPVIHLSTDYVFPGDQPAPRRETDPTGPVSVYGASKLKGEELVAAATADHVILRTAWVHAPWGANFVRSMLRLAASRPEIGIVDDQHGAPTSAVDIAEAVVKVARRLLSDRDPALRGIYHLANAGETTWAGFAEEIFRVSARLGGPVSTVRRIETKDFPTPARRPAWSRLDCSRLSDRFGIALRPWPEPVGASVEGLLAERAAGGTQ
jgi:dTDP-4-dehydrorhamnose reductase